MFGEQDKVKKGRFVCTTSWDDGSVHDLRLADMLVKYGVPATFYIARKSEYRGLSDNQIRQLGTSFEIGAHTLNHVSLDEASDDVAYTEIGGSKTWVEQISGRPCKMFCFPRGKFRASQLSIVRNAGFTGVRTVELLSLSSPRVVRGVAVMGTTVQAFNHNFFGYVKNGLRRWAGGNLWRYVKHGCGNDWVHTAKSLLLYASANGGVFHLWGHSWEIEETGQWQALEQTLAAISEYMQSASLLTDMELCSHVGKAEDYRRPALVSR